MDDALVADVLACRACEMAGFLHHANPIRPELLADARMMLIGQAPGAITDVKGYHFAGPAGRFLESWLSRAGFPERYFREHVYLTSLTRCFPGKAASGNGDRAPSRNEVALCRRFLDREFALVRPRVVLLVGRMAIDAFIPGKAPLTELIGSTFELDGRTFVPLPHASGVSRWLNLPENRARLDAALRELSRLRVALNL
jgi:uracil-DNA glycosylase family 4